MASDADARSHLLKILDESRTFVELGVRITEQYQANSDGPFEHAMRFLLDEDASCLDLALRERFAQVLSRFVENPRALRLAGILEAGKLPN